MIATLNIMPESPAQHMKDYISLHYFYEQKEAAEEEGTEEEEEVKREGLRRQDVEELRAEVARLTREHHKYRQFKQAFAAFTKKMNEVSATQESANPTAPAQAVPSEGSISRRTPGSKEAAKSMRRIDSEFGVNESEEEKNVIVSPKSSMISSRLAEPETADLWANRMIDFHTKYGALVDMAAEKADLARSAAAHGVRIGTAPTPKGGVRRPSEAELAAGQRRLKECTEALSRADWGRHLNGFMDALSEFLIASASQNSFGSISSQVAMALANSVPVMTNIEDLAGAEEKAANELLRVAQENETKFHQESLLSQIRVIQLRKNEKIYSMAQTFNVVVSGSVLDMATGRTLNRFGVFADFPIQVNALDHAHPLQIMTL